MAMSSAGVQVNVIDESFYTSAAPGTTPLIIVASKTNKNNSSGTGIAPGTLASNAGKVYTITSQRDLSDTFGTPYFYTVKANMGDKPVVFVNYLNSIRYINWLHNGAILSVDNITYIDSTINNGAYDILDVGNNSYLINKNTYQKYY